MLSTRRILLNTTAVTAASFWRIAVSFILQLLVARILDVPALGTFALMLAWLQIAQIAAEAGLPAWMVRECAGRPDRRRVMLALVMRLEVILVLIAAAALLLLTYLFPAIMPPLPLVAITVLSLPFYAVTSASLALFESAESFDRVFVVDVATNTLLLAASAILLIAGYGLSALFAALVACQLFSSLLALLLVWRSRLITPVPPNPVSHDTPPTWRAALQASRTYFTVAFADVLQQRADLLLLGAVASPAATGLYAAAVSVVRVLLKLVQAFWRALFPTLSRLFNLEAGTPAAAIVRDADSPDGYRRLHELALRLALAVTVGFAVVMMPLAATIATLLFGVDFAGAAPALAILLWSAPLYAWETYAITRLMAQRNAGAAVRISIVHLALLVLVLPLLAWQWGANGAAAASVLAALAGSLAGIWSLRQWNVLPAVDVLLRFASCALVASLFARLATDVVAWFGVAPRTAFVNPLIGALVAFAVYSLALIALRLVTASDLQRFRGVFRKPQS